MKQVLMADGGMFEVPMFDPVVANHFASASSYTDTLLNEVNSQLYAPLFAFRRDLTFLDIGANAGLVSIYAAPSCKRIVAVEPATATFAVLKAMTLKFPQIECFNAALTPIDGPCEFFENDLNSTASSTVNTYGTKTTVQGFTLSRILSINQLEYVDVLKCDAEGAEGEALNFAELMVLAPIVLTYWIEFHNCPKTTWEHKLGTTVENLSRIGYHKQKIDGMRLMATR